MRLTPVVSALGGVASSVISGLLDVKASVALGSPHGDNRDESGAWAADRRGREAVRPPLVVGAGRAQPDRRGRCRRPLLLGLRRQALPRLRLAARQRLDGAPPRAARPRDQGAGGEALPDRPADGERAALDARAPARRG